MLPLAVQFPSFIRPEVIPGLPVRWYGLMYIVAFSVAYVVCRRMIREKNFPMSDEKLSSMFCYVILGLILGARIFSTLVYETPGQNIYLQKPWLIFWPFRNGHFTGLTGMSYHGGAIGGILGIIIWSKVNGYHIRDIGDLCGSCIPLGYTFGRIGNFINAELYGRVTASPVGMIFPIPEYDTAHRFSSSVAWVRDFAAKTGIALPDDPSILVNLPRHPSQLYEAFFEGIFLWSVIWLVRKHRPFRGFLAGLYIGGYGFIRFFLEYFREPDADLGYRIQLGEFVGLSDIAHSHPLLSFSTGQILCLGTVTCMIAWWILVSRFPDSRSPYIYEEKKVEKPDKNARRKLRKKLKGLP